MADRETLSQSGQFLHKVFNRQLIPSMLVSLGYTLNVLFDGIIVGQKLGVESFAAINICMPVYLFLCTMGSLIGVGCYLLSSRAIGTGNTERSNRIFNSAILYMAIAGAFVTAAGLALIHPIVNALCGGTPFQDVYDYASVTLIGSVPKMFLYIPMYYLVLDGKGKWATISTVIMVAANILLDLLMVCILDMGTAGAAWASVIATMLSTLVGMAALLHKSTFRIDFKFAHKDIIQGMFLFGIPSAANNLMAALRVLFLNSLLLTKSSDAVCLFSILNNLSELSLVIVDGVPKTAMPLLAIYSAERSHAGVRILMKHQSRLGLIMTVVFGLLVTAFSGPLALLYGMDPAVSGSVLLPFACFSLSLPAAMLLRILILYYNADGKNVLSTVLTVARIVVFPVLFLWIMMTTDGFLWLFWPAAEAAALVLLFAGLAVFRNKSTSFPLLLKDDSFEKSLEFSVSATDDEICSASEKIGGYCEEFGMNPRQTMRISLALEEILTLMRTQCMHEEATETFDLRVFTSEERTGIRIRCMGSQYNPFGQPDDADECMGVRMVQSITSDITYSYVYGMNNLVVII